LFEDLEFSSLRNESLASILVMDRGFNAFYKVSELGNVTDSPIKSLEEVK
jgi:hypothetical protein